MKNKLTHHLLPTEDASPLGLYSDILYQLEKVENKNDDVKHHHLYLVSDAPIKDGDYIIHKNQVHKVRQNSGLYLSVYELSSIDIRTDLCQKIEFTTDPQLIADGVGKIDGDTKAKIVCPICEGVGFTIKGYTMDCENCKGKKNIEVNFLTEFCNRYNQKGDQKVDVEKLAEKYSENNYSIELAEVVKDVYKDAHNQAFQSTGPFSLDEVLEKVNKAYEIGKNDCENPSVDFLGNSTALKYFIQSLTPQPKGEMVIEVEMEDWIRGTKENGREVFQKIKLTNGQPTLIFK